MRRVCGTKNVEILLALVREIEVLSPDNGGEVTEDLRRTIQESFVAIENRLTKEKQTEAATAKGIVEARWFRRSELDDESSLRSSRRTLGRSLTGIPCARGRPRDPMHWQLAVAGV